jgi:hypothetical protein
LQYYQELCKAHSTIVDFRSKLLALLPIAAGGSLLLFAKSGDADLRQWAPPAGTFAFLVTLGLFVYELRQIRECLNLRCQAAEAETSLRIPHRLGQFRDAPPLSGRIVGFELASWIVYTTVLTSWAFLAAMGVFSPQRANSPDPSTAAVPNNPDSSEYLTPCVVYAALGALLLGVLVWRCISIRRRTPCEPTKAEPTTDTKSRAERHSHHWSEPAR